MMAAMPIDPVALAKSVARLEGVDPVDTGLDAALEQAAFELLRAQARSTRRRLHDVATETVREAGLPG
jgi:hypothetical protein